MAGTYSGFDAEQFRSAIRFAMEMGTHPNPDVAPTFVFPPGPATYFKDGVEVTNPALDSDGYPFDPGIVKEQTPGARVQVNCAVDVGKADADEIPVGNFRPVKATVTLLDEDYALVKGCREMILNEDTYVYGYEPGAVGLFEVGIHVMIFYALQET